MISKANIKDLQQIYQVTQNCTKHLIESGIFQWNEFYPSKEILKEDINLGQLWKLEFESKIIGIIVLTTIEDAAYKNVNWLTTNSDNLYVHRLAVNPIYQKRGFAQKMMLFAEEYAKNQQYKSIRLDTFSQNKRNLIFYKKLNYVKLEEIYFPKQSSFPFLCFEKILNE